MIGRLAFGHPRCARVHLFSRMLTTIPVIVGSDMEPTETPNDALRPAAIIRDVALLWVLTLAGGFVAGVAAPPTDPSRRMMAIAISNVLFSLIGFVLVGYLAGARRWMQLLVVTVILWFTSLINLLFGLKFFGWLMSLPVLLILMGIGGGISYLFRR